MIGRSADGISNAPGVDTISLKMMMEVITALYACTLGRGNENILSKDN